MADEARPDHPKYGPALSGAPDTIDGTVFWPYRVGISRYCRATADGRLEIRRGHGEGTTFHLIVDGVGVKKSFRLFRTAARAGIEFVAARK